MEKAVQTLNGIWRIIPSPVLTEIIAQSGFHFQILDCEHGAYDYATLLDDIRVCDQYHTSAFIRVSGLDKVEVQRCLDLGAHGIVFPQLTGYQDFAAATRLLHYAPQGDRGYNPFVRAAGYGIERQERKRPLCIVIIETLQAVEELDQIVQLEGIDIIYIGSYDLSAQLDCIGQMDHPKLMGVVDTIIEKCKFAHKKVGVMTMSAEHQQKFAGKGVHVFVHGVDSYQINKAFTALIP